MHCDYITNKEQKLCKFFKHNITNKNISIWERNCYNACNAITNAEVRGPGSCFEKSERTQTLPGSDGARSPFEKSKGIQATPSSDGPGTAVPF